MFKASFSVPVLVGNVVPTNLLHLHKGHYLYIYTIFLPVNEILSVWYCFLYRVLSHSCCRLMLTISESQWLVFFTHNVSSVTHFDIWDISGCAMWAPVIPLQTQMDNVFQSVIAQPLCLCILYCIHSCLLSINVHICMHLKRDGENFDANSLFCLFREKYLLSWGWALKLTWWLT